MEDNQHDFEPQPSGPETTPADRQSQGAAPERQPAGKIANEHASRDLSIDDDWRAYIAGDNDDALKELSQYSTPKDLAAALLAQKQQLSERAMQGAFPRDGTDEEKDAWREANGVPAEGSLEAYGIEVPEGYHFDGMESDMANEFAAEMAEAGMPPAAVQTAMDYWFRANAINRQEMMKIADERHQQWSDEIAGEFGKDAQLILSAGDAYLSQMIGDEQTINELLTAELPGGGLLGKHPAFVKMVADLALKNGFGDRLEARSMESGGRSLAEQQSEIENMMMKDPARYNSPEVQSRYAKIIEHRMKRGEIDDFGNEMRR